MATKKNPADFSVEEKLKALYQLQTMLSEIDKIKTLRGELPLEVQDLKMKLKVSPPEFINMKTKSRHLTPT